MLQPELTIIQIIYFPINLYSLLHNDKLKTEQTERSIKVQNVVDADLMMQNDCSITE